MNRSKPTDPISRAIIARNERHNAELNDACAPQEGFEEGDHMRLLMEPRCLLYYDDPPQGSGQSMRYIALPRGRKRTPRQRLFRAIWRGWLSIRPAVCGVLAFALFMAAGYLLVCWFLTAQ